MQFGDALGNSFGIFWKYFECALRGCWDTFLEILSEDVVWQFEQDRPAKLTDLFGRVLTINGIRTVAHNAKATSRA